MIGIQPSDRVRDAVLADLPRIVAIYNTAIPGRLATADTEPVTVESRQGWFAAHCPDRRPLWVLEREGDIVAWISLQDFYGRPAYRATCEVSLYVAPEFQRLGLGIDLLERLLDRCPSLGVNVVLAFIFAHNSPSLELFRRMGFLAWGELPHVAEMDGETYHLAIWGQWIDPEIWGNRP
jgi:L-amino acid N-acyltransferase YncA